ncbi:transposase, partial [Mesorhizobium sp. M00.F.Ca.ET.186.01.1.1]
KASRADHGTKVAIIQNNRDKYSVSAMCDVLQIARSTFYYEAKEQTNEDDVTEAIADIFHKNRKAYGTRKIKVKLQERGFVVSRRRIGRIRKSRGLFPRTPCRNISPLRLRVMKRLQPIH